MEETSRTRAIELMTFLDLHPDPLAVGKIIMEDYQAGNTDSLNTIMAAMRVRNGKAREAEPGVELETEDMETAVGNLSYRAIDCGSSGSDDADAAIIELATNINLVSPHIKRRLSDLMWKIYGTKKPTPKQCIALVAFIQKLRILLEENYD